MTAERTAHWRPIVARLLVAPLLLAAAVLSGCSSSGANPPRSPIAVAAGPAAPEAICTSPVRPAGAIDVRQRFGQWVLGPRSLPAGQNPQSAFAAVTASNLQNTNVYVVTHGWAPGWNPAVLRASSKILWWSTAAGVHPKTYGPCTTSTCLWPSDWAWTASSTTYNGMPFVVSNGGLLAAIVVNDPDALVLAYSWLDDSGTDGGAVADLSCAYLSQGYTNLNGLRLAAGLRTILGDSFWQPSNNNSLHLIGHSHGSKVVTTAAWALQKNGLRVDQLTLLDSPEDFETRDDGAANFNWLYLGDMTIGTRPSKTDPKSVFVDNYVSEFSFPYTDFASLSGVVDVSLDPEKLFGHLDPGDDHTYAATWYSGAAAVGNTLRPPVLVALGWSPVLQPGATARLAHLYNQTWPSVTPVGQIQLDSASPSPSSSFSLSGVGFRNANPSGTARWDGTQKVLTFVPGGNGTFAVDFSCSGSSIDYEGVAFDVELQSTATAQSQLVVELGGTRYLVIDGDYKLGGAYRVSFNAGNESSSLTFKSQAPGMSGPAPWITIDNFACIELSD